MKTAVVYYSYHHGNTKKLLDALPEDVTLLEAEGKETDLSAYDRIGFASGIYYGTFAKQIIEFAGEKLPEEKDVFYLYTHGAPSGNFLKDMRRIAQSRRCRELGEYHCQGFDTFGPFKLVGGIAKGHPTQEEIAAAAAFYQSL